MIFDTSKSRYVHLECDSDGISYLASQGAINPSPSYDDDDFDDGWDTPKSHNNFGDTRTQFKDPEFENAPEGIGETISSDALKILKEFASTKIKQTLLDVEFEIKKTTKADVDEAMKIAGGLIEQSLKASCGTIVSDQVSRAIQTVDANHADKQKKLDQKIAEANKAIEKADAKIEEILRSEAVKVTHVFKFDDKVYESEEGEVYNEKFPWIVRLASARKPIFLPGPTGSGKTHISQQLAKVLKMDFGMISCSPGMTESTLLGRSIPNLTTGEESYQETDFVRIYENGGVFLLDELDAADPTVLLVMNSALSNSVLSVPNRKGNTIAKQHKDFILIAGANTMGTGADAKYVGRNPIDLATLDRFRIGFVPVDYSPVIETRLCKQRELRESLWSWRRLIAENRLDRVLSTRFMKDASEMMSFGATFDDIREAFFAGWPQSERVKIDVIKNLDESNLFFREVRQEDKLEIENEGSETTRKRKRNSLSF